MSQISKRYIPPWTQEKILDIFLNSMLKIKNKNLANNFFNEFFTPTEKIMLIKRIACLYLLFKKVSIRECSDILKLSTSTVAKYCDWLNKNKTISDILRRILKEENFLKLVDKIINEYIHPPGSVGTNWKSAMTDKINYELRKNSPL